MNEQTQNRTVTELSKKEEGRRMTTKSATARSSITDTRAEHKKVTRAEECQAQSDDMRLMVDCRISADASIINFISHTGIQNQMGMLMETTAKAARRILLLAADRVGQSTEVFENARMEINLRFAEPKTLFQICRTEEEDGKN